MLESLSAASSSGAQRLRLGVKDNLRQVRLQLRVGSRELAGRLGADLPPGPKGPGSKSPWDSVQGAAAHMFGLLEAADRVASGLLGSSPREGQLECTLVPFAHAAQCAGTPGGARLLTRGWYAAWKHLLRQQGAADLCVSELALHELLLRLRASAVRDLARGAASAREADRDPPCRLAGLLVWHAARGQPGILRTVEGVVLTDRDPRPVLLRAAAAFAVACESRGTERHDRVAPEAAEALTLADELVAGGLERWQKALASERAAEALAQECAFHVRHL